MALDFEFPGRQDSDWDGARTRQTVLMTRSAEWVQSAFSCSFDLNGITLIAPNRDFPYEGLLVYADGEHWKFIDCIAVAVESQDGTPVALVQDSSKPAVRVNPWCITYRYRCVLPGGRCELPLSVTYRLHSVGSPDAVTGSVELDFPQAATQGKPHLVPMIVPMVDLRHMYGNTELDCYQFETRDERDRKTVSITAYNRNLSFHFDGGQIERFPSPETLRWHYRLGVGQRTETIAPETRVRTTTFVGEEKAITGFFGYRPPLDNTNCQVTFFIECRLADGPSVASLTELERLRRESIQRDDSQARQVQSLFPIAADPPIRHAIHGRIVGLTKFKTLLRNDQVPGGALVPHAGAWWFRTAWFRDAFEGILSSLKTLMAIPEERDIVREVIRFALSSQDDATGLIPNRIPEFRNEPTDYRSADASLLCFLAAEGFLRLNWEESLAAEVVEAAMKMVTRFAERGSTERDSIEPDGPPRIHPQTGLVLTAAHHSWIDTRNLCVEHAGRQLQGLPNRFSPDFVRALLDHLESPRDPTSVFLSPHFFLPEINAQWISVLKGLVWTTSAVDAGRAVHCVATSKWYPFRETATAFLKQARSNYIATFWNKRIGYLFNAVYEDRALADVIECEASVTAAALLGEEFFTPRHLQGIWTCVKHALTLARRGDAALANGHFTGAGKYRASRQGSWSPLGLLVKNESARTYYDDRQYHGGVMWLRSTHYLVQLLRMIGKQELARDILLNVLDHQMAEGAVFYNHELLSPPVGNNPEAREATAHNPVPVKNPIQFWSQWCDQMVEVFGNRESACEK